MAATTSAAELDGDSTRGESEASCASVAAATLAGVNGVFENDDDDNDGEVNADAGFEDNAGKIDANADEEDEDEVRG